MLRQMRVLAVSFGAVVLLSAVSAGAAQAAGWETAEWNIEGLTKFGEGIGLSTSMTSEKAKLSVPALGLTLETKPKTEGGNVTSTGAGIRLKNEGGATKITFEDVEAPGTTCAVRSPNEPVGSKKVSTEAVATYLVKKTFGTETEYRDIFIPVEGTNNKFVTVKLEGCALAGEYPVKGSSVSKLGTPETLALSHELEFPAPERESLKTTEYEGAVFGKLKFGAAEATLEVKTSETGTKQSDG
jgi:hypothetical protein